MTGAEYQSLIGKIPFGKRLPGTLYVYRDDNSFGAELDALLRQLIAAYQIGDEFNLIKFRTDELKISFLSYPDFFEDPHPALQKAIAIDLARGKARQIDYVDNINPPILHRKESFLPPDHPQSGKFRGLTEAEEAAGLYEEASTIGFKMNWERLLAAKGVEIRRHRLVRRETAQGQNGPPREILVERHKTALTRYELSKPVKTLLEYGFLKTGTTLFDYGCGQGSDVRGLQALGYQADGWDPVYRRETAKREADVVNLGYVLNVIEDPAERLEALVDAYRHARRLLVVSALITETADTNRAAKFQDGIVTRWNTFQKYFEQQELQQYIEDGLETTAVPVALGIFYVFRDPREQQDFLSARSRRTIDWAQISGRLGLGQPAKGLWEALYREHKELLDGFGNIALELGRLPEPTEFEGFGEVCEKLGSAKRAIRAFVQGGGAKGIDWAEIKLRFGIGQQAKRQWEVLYDTHKGLLDAFWNCTLQLGRVPAPEQFPPYAELCAAVGSAKRALRILMQRGGGDLLRQSAESRKNDLLVYLALANLRKRVPFGHLSPGLRLDVRSFFGNYQRALSKGLELLYAAGDPGEIELASEGLELGWQDEQALYVHRSLLDAPPPILCAHVGCTTWLN